MGEESGIDHDGWGRGVVGELKGGEASLHRGGQYIWFQLAW